MLGCWTFCCPEAADEGFTSSLEVVCFFQLNLHTDSKTRTSLDEVQHIFRVFAAVQIESCSEQEITLLQIFCLFCICAVFLCKHTTELEVLTLFNQPRALLSFLLSSSFVCTEFFICTDPYVITHAVFLIIFTCKA